MKHDVIKEIGKILEKSRKSKGLSIEEVNKGSLIHPKVLNSIENGTATEHLNALYLKSFLKRYAQFLDVDISDRIEECFVSQKNVAQEQKLHVDGEEERSGIIPPQYMPSVSLGIGILVIVALIFLAVVKVKRISSDKPSVAVETEQVKKKNTQKKAAVKPVKKGSVKPVIEKTAVSSAVKTDNVSLSVSTDAAVWMDVKSDGSTVFKNTLKQNETEKWSANKSLALRVGKLEAINFTVNGIYYGKIGDGVKNLTIDSRGIILDGTRVSLPE